MENVSVLPNERKLSTESWISIHRIYNISTKFSIIFAIFAKI